jgi:hypothetical protein
VQDKYKKTIHRHVIAKAQINLWIIVSISQNLAFATLYSF